VANRLRHPDATLPKCRVVGIVRPVRRVSLREPSWAILSLLDHRCDNKNQKKGQETNIQRKTKRKMKRQNNEFGKRERENEMRLMLVWMGLPVETTLLGRQGKVCALHCNAPYVPVKDKSDDSVNGSALWITALDFLN